MGPALSGRGVATGTTLTYVGVTRTVNIVKIRGWSSTTTLVTNWTMYVLSLASLGSTEVGYQQTKYLEQPNMYLEAELCGNSTYQVKLDHLITRSSSSSEYYERYVLGNRGHDWYNFGSVRLQSVVCLAAAWALVTACLIKGRSSRKYKRKNKKI